MKKCFFQAAVVSILLYGCTTWTLTKRLEKKLDGNYTRMMRPILNKSWRQHATKQQLYGHLPPITKTIQARRTRHAGHCWRSKDELISDVLIWTPAYGQAKAGRPARTYIQQLYEDTGCSPEDLPEAMKDWEKWRERVRDIRAIRLIQTLVIHSYRNTDVKLKREKINFHSACRQHLTQYIKIILSWWISLAPLGMWVLASRVAHWINTPISFLQSLNLSTYVLKQTWGLNGLSWFPSLTSK